MVHIKWFFALVVVAVISVAITYYATEKYVTERTMGQLSEMSIMRNTTYVLLTREIEDKKYGDAKTTLRKIFDLEVKDIQRAREVMENSYLANANVEYIDRINRYLALPPARSDK